MEAYQETQCKWWYVTEVGSDSVRIAEINVAAGCGVRQSGHGNQKQANELPAPVRSRHTECEYHSGVGTKILRMYAPAPPR